MRFLPCRTGFSTSRSAREEAKTEFYIRLPPCASLPSAFNAMLRRNVYLTLLACLPLISLASIPHHKSLPSLVDGGVSASFPNSHQVKPAPAPT